jgi:hypothetical protein
MSGSAQTAIERASLSSLSASLVSRKDDEAAQEEGQGCEDLASAFVRLNFGARSAASASGSSSEKHLPDDAVRAIANYLVAGEPPGHVLVHLLAFCGVCKQWRSVGQELGPGQPLGFDVLENTFCSLSSIQRFRRLNAVQKEGVFCAAAALLTGAGGRNARPFCASLAPR